MKLPNQKTLLTKATITIKVGTFSDCTIYQDSYNNNLPAIIITDNQGMTLCKATSNVPEIALKPNQVIIKNYSENEGLLDSLIDLNIIHPPLNAIQNGNVICPICTIKEKKE